MAVEHLEFHVEEQSMEAALRTLLPRVIGDLAFDIYTYQGKRDLLRELPKRLRSQASWLPATWRIIVIVDVDNGDCATLRRRLDRIARDAGMTVRGEKAPWQIANRIAIEELEAWYFGDWAAVRAAYPRVPDGIVRQAAYRHPDKIRGGTWEALERVLQVAGYFAGGLQKIAAARDIAAHMDVTVNTSPSFVKLREVLIEAGSS
jgi:hypothetical protein